MLLLMFQICISQNPVMCVCGGFPKLGHIFANFKKIEIIITLQNT